jgi:integrase
MRKQLIFKWKGGTQLGCDLASLYEMSTFSDAAHRGGNGKGIHMRGIYEKVKGSKDFYVRYTDANGQRHREHVGRYSAAVEALVARRREVREGRFIPPCTPVDRITFADLADKYMTVKAPRVAANTLAGNQRQIRRLKEFFGSAAAREITPAKIDELLLEFKYTKNRPPKKGASGQTKKAGEVSGPALNSYRSLLSSIFKYGVLHGHVKENPVSATKAFEKHEGIVRYLTRDEEASLRGVIREENAEFEPEMDLFLNTGLRRHEARLLTWDKIDLDRGILTVPSDTKTGRRFIPINSAARAAIVQLHRQSEGSPYVCPHRGTNTNAIWMRAWLRKAGVLNFRPTHDFRHTFASRLVMAGVDLSTVQKFMGHADIQMTMRYAHLSPEHGKAAIEKLVAQPAAPAAIAIPKRPTRRAVAQSSARIARSA